MARQWHSIPNRDALARLRSLAGDRGYRLERGVAGDTWILTDEKTGTPAFSVERAIKFLSALGQ